MQLRLPNTSRQLLKAATFFFVLLTSVLLVLSQAAKAEKTWKLINIDMDGSIPAQTEVAAKVTDRSDLRKMEGSLRLYAKKKGLIALRSAVSDLRAKYPDRWLTLNGSGDFHHTSAILLESLPESYRPITLIMVDNHPDWFKMPLHYHCGTWVATALHLPFVEKVILVGQNSKDLKGNELIYAPLSDLYSGRVTMYPLQREKTTVPLHWTSSVLGAKSCTKTAWGTTITFETIKELGINALADRLADQLKGKNVYLSIDKDVLGKSWAVTDWDQGELSVDDLLVLIHKVNAKANFVGVDICGEQSPDALTGPWKRFDAGRITDTRSHDWQATNAVNERTNLRIIEAVAHPQETGQ